MRTYQIVINEYQRQMLLTALQADVTYNSEELKKLPGDSSVIVSENNALDECRIMQDMLRDMFMNEDPDVIHGLCL